MRLGCHGVFHSPFTSNPIYILTFRNTTFSQNTVLSPSLRSYTALIAVKCFKSKSHSVSKSLCHKRHKMSCGDLLNKFDDLVKRFKAAFNEIVEASNAEKQRMEAIEVSDDDIIHLNVGGQKFSTTRATLCQVEESLLATMFNGRWEDRVQKDKDGVVFFDFNPEYFGWILDYLRAKKISSPENPAVLAEVPKNQMKNFNTLLEYLGLSDEIVPASSTDKFNVCSSGITVQENGKVAVHDSNQGHKYVLGQNVYQHGIVRFKLKLESFQNNNWIMVGIVKADVVPKDNYSHNCVDSKGWVLGNNRNQGMYENGSLKIYDSLVNQTKQGDKVELVLDCDAAKFSLHLFTGQKFEIDIPKSQAWRLHVNLNGANDKIRIEL